MLPGLRRLSDVARILVLPLVSCLVSLSLGHAHAQDGGRLLATSGVTEVEGAGGGGLVPWALITGYGTNDEVGGNLHYTFVDLPDFDLQAAGAGIGLYDRVELSYTHQWFDTGNTGGRLGLGDGYQFHQDVYGLKTRLWGKMLYDQDTWMPQVSVGTQVKVADHVTLLQALGARSATGADFYLAATKLFLAQSLLVDATVRATRANQFGLLGFGGDRSDSNHAEFESSAAFLVSRRLVVGAEFRTKPDNLSFAREGDAYDLFLAYFFNRHLSGTLAFTDLGGIANQGRQRGLYLSLQVGL